MVNNFFSKINLLGSIVFVLHIVVMHLLFPILAIWGVGVWVPDGFQYLFPFVVSFGIWSMSKSYKLFDQMNPLQILIVGAILFSFGLFGHSHEGHSGHSHSSVGESLDWLLILGGVLLTIGQVWHFKLNPPHKNDPCSLSAKNSNNLKIVE